MVDDLIPILTRFHREMVLPDIERIMGEYAADHVTADTGASPL